MSGSTGRMPTTSVQTMAKGEIASDRLSFRQRSAATSRIGTPNGLVYGRRRLRTRFLSNRAHFMGPRSWRFMAGQGGSGRLRRFHWSEGSVGERFTRCLVFVFGCLRPIRLGDQDEQAIRSMRSHGRHGAARVVGWRRSREVAGCFGSDPTVMKDERAPGVSANAPSRNAERSVARAHVCSRGRPPPLTATAADRGGGRGLCGLRCSFAA